MLLRRRLGSGPRAEGLASRLRLVAVVAQARRTWSVVSLGRADDVLVRLVTDEAMTVGSDWRSDDWRHPWRVRIRSLSKLSVVFDVIARGDRDRSRPRGGTRFRMARTRFLARFDKLGRSIREVEA